MTLTAHDLHFAYNGRPVLRGMGLALRRGESLGILGVNGAGKSTLLKCLNRILSPQQGVVMLGERDLARSDPTQVARMMGYVPQRASSEQLSVFDAVLLGRKPHIKWQASGHDLEVVARVLERMGLTDLGLRPVSALSGGEAQKVVIARALAQEPRLLLLDEPTSSLDMRNQLEVMELLMSAVRDQGIGAAVCLHDINLALRYLDRLVLLKQGRVHASLEPGELTPEVIREVYGVRAVLAEVQGQRVVIPQGTDRPAVEPPPSPELETRNQA